MLEEDQQMPLEKQRNRNAKGGEGADDFRETEMQEYDCASDAFRETGAVLYYSYINFKTTKNCFSEKRRKLSKTVDTWVKVQE